METGEVDNEEEEVDVEETEMLSLAKKGKGKQASNKLLRYDFDALRRWYLRKKHEGTAMDSLVVIVQEAESVDPQILKDLISMVSDSLDLLPFVFLFGVSTSPRQLSQQLDQEALSRLSTERFQLESGVLSLDVLIEELFINRVRGLKFGFTPYAALIDDYLLRSLSISGLFKEVKYAVMEYYYSNPLSILCERFALNGEDKDKETEEIKLPRLTQAHLTEIRMLPSFRHYVETIKGTDGSRVVQLLSDDRVMEEAVAGWLRDLHTYHLKYRTGFRVLCALQRRLTTGVSRKPERVLYFMGLDQALHENEFVKTASTLAA